MEINQFLHNKLVWALGLFFFAAGTASAGTGETTTVRNGPWRAGGGIGFLTNTPDNDSTAFAVDLNADYFFDNAWSLGPLAQLAFTNDLALYGFSGQLKYWFPAFDSAGRVKPFVEAGVGIVHAAIQRDDTSWLVPLGAGLEYTTDSGMSLYGVFLLNLTDLDAGRGADSDVMPGVTFGARF